MIWSSRVTLEPLGDQGVLATFPSEEAAARFAQALNGARPAWLVDVVLAYLTVAVFHDPGQTTLEEVMAHLRAVRPAGGQAAGRVHVIPCCYERQLDLAGVSARLGLDGDAVIRLHHQPTYAVYAIGFCPGFPYLGYLPTALCGVPRLDKPRVRVAPGSVGLTGTQTGVYPLPTPGGWSLIGQTPLELVNVADEYFPLRAGDQVRFERIDEAEFQRLLGERLDVPP
jgi:inhibitor of KinA